MKTPGQLSVKINRQLSIETALLDWQRDEVDGARSDTILYGSTTLRAGVTHRVEVLAGWTPFGHVRVRDEATRQITSTGGAGDVMVGFKVDLANPGGDGVSFALQPFAIVPVGKIPSGVGDWGAGVVAPIAYDAGHGVSLQLTGEMDAATDGDGSGRHLSYSAVTGVGYSVTDTLQLTIEVAVRRDNDPALHITQAFVSSSLSWRVSDNTHLDMGAAPGISSNSPKSIFYFGISQRI